MKTVTLTLPLPPSVNAMYRNVAGRGRVKTGAYKAWLRLATTSLASQNPPRISKPYAIRILLPLDYRSDVSNRVKAVEDLLVSSEIIADDRWIERVTAERTTARGGDCTVEIMGEWRP